MASSSKAKSSIKSSNSLKPNKAQINKFIAVVTELSERKVAWCLRKEMGECEHLFDIDAIGDDIKFMYIEKTPYMRGRAYTPERVSKVMISKNVLFRQNHFL